MKLLSLFFLLSFSVHARIAIISDIDDTIKNTHLLSGNVIFNALQTDKVFSGMPDLYRSLEAQFLNQKEEYKFYYLSNAPRSLFGKKASIFLNKNGFPFGEIILREKLKEKSHKLDAIKLIVEDYAPETIIFIGDNGEKDIEIYHEAFLNILPNSSVKNVHQFIRLAYHTNKKGKNIYEEQIFFSSAIEIAERLNSLGILENEGVVQTIKASLNDDGSLKIPRWINCREIDLSKFDFSSELLKIGKTAIENRCIK